MKRYGLPFVPLSFLIFFSFILEISKAGDTKLNSVRSQRIVDDYKLVDVNTVSAWITNYGSFFRHPTTGNSGFEWPAGGGVFAVYASGMWISAKVNNNIHLAVAEYSYEFQPGKILGPGNWDDPSKSRYQMYKVNAGDTLPSEAIQDGAPSNFPGDQFLWCVYNDADPTIHVNMGAPPLEVEVQQSFFGYSTAGPLGNTVFGKWIIINKSSSDWDSTYITIWSDPDLGDYGDDLIGSDTTRDMGYCYNSNNNDGQYGSAPPAVGYVLLQGPVIPSPGDTAVFLGKLLPDYKNLPMTSFIYYRNDNTALGNPQTLPEVRNYQMAHWRDGVPLTYGGNGYGGTTLTNFAFSGDPEAGTGWLDSSPSDRRFLINVGPVNIAAGDTQEVVFATTIARGTNNLNSVTLLKQYAGLVRGFYNQNLATGIEKIGNSSIPTSYDLSQNYPNPFNPTTTIEFAIPQAEFVTLKIYSLLGEEVAALVSEKLPVGKYKYEWDANDFASGVYFYRLETGNFNKTKKLILIK